mgnify:CR=1 FL=1
MQLLRPRAALQALALPLLWCTLLHITRAQGQQQQKHARLTKCHEVENPYVEQDYNPHFVGFLSQCSVRRFARVGSYDWL